MPAPASSPRGHSFRTFDWDAATGMVDNLLSSYSLQGALDELRK